MRVSLFCFTKDLPVTMFTEAITTQLIIVGQSMYSVFRVPYQWLQPQPIWHSRDSPKRQLGGLKHHQQTVMYRSRDQP